jgi:hypothetical protein
MQTSNRPLRTCTVQLSKKSVIPRLLIVFPPPTVSLHCYTYYLFWQCSGENVQSTMENLWLGISVANAMESRLNPPAIEKRP